jgi:hypothetical protein
MNHEEALLLALKIYHDEDLVRAHIDDNHLVVETTNLCLDCDLLDDQTAFWGADTPDRLYSIIDAFRTLRTWYLDWLTPPNGYDVQ